MNKEEILVKSRKDNKAMDEMELIAQVKAGKLAMTIGAILCMIFLMLDTLRNGGVNQLLFSVYLGMHSVFHFAIFKGIHKKNDLIFGIIFGFFAVCFIGLYIAEWIIID